MKTIPTQAMPPCGWVRSCAMFGAPFLIDHINEAVAQMGDIRKHPAVVFPNFCSTSLAFQLSHSAQGLVDSLNIWGVTVVVPMSSLYSEFAKMSKPAVTK